MTDTLRGAVWMLGTIASFTIMALAGREVADQLDTFEIMMLRSLVGVVIVVAVIALQNRWAELRTQRVGLHAVRNIAHFTGQNLWFYALALIPLAQVFALEFTTPLWVLLLSPLILGERFTATRAICAALGFVGILIVTRPGSIGLSAGVLTAASCAVFFALTIITTKRLTATESIACILFYLTTMQLVFGVVAAGYDGDVALPTGSNILWVFLIGLAGLSAHFCYTKALTLAPAALVAPIDFARLPTIAIVAWAVYAEALDPLVFLGALIIFAGNYLNIWTETRRARTGGT